MGLAAGQKMLTPGQILKSMEPYTVVPQMKALDEC
jgi:hypothetical protein